MLLESHTSPARMPHTPFAQYMAAFGPAGTVFEPSREGRRHCEEEFAPWRISSTAHLEIFFPADPAGMLD